jgi:hypothetical protein
MSGRGEERLLRRRKVRLRLDRAQGAQLLQKRLEWTPESQLPATEEG